MTPRTGEVLRPAKLAERRRRVDGDRRRRRRRMLVGFAVAATILAGAFMLSRSSLFGISGIDVRGNHELSTEQVLAASGLRLGQNVLWLDGGEIEARLRDLDLVRSVTVRRVGLSRVRIAIVERAAALEVRSGQARWWFDDRGKQLPLQSPPDGRIPVLLLSSEAPAVQGVTPPLDQSIITGVASLWRALPDWVTADLAEFQAPSLQEISFLWRDTWVVLGTPERIGEKVGSFRAVLDAAGRSHRSLRRLDVRAPDHPAAIFA